MNSFLQNTLGSAALLSALLPFNAAADNGAQDVLLAVREEVGLRLYQAEATQDICDQLSNEVFPFLNALDLTSEFSAQFVADDISCEIEYGGKYVDRLQGSSLFRQNYEFDNGRLAEKLVRQLNADEQQRVADALEELLPPTQ